MLIFLFIRVAALAFRQVFSDAARAPRRRLLQDCHSDSQRQRQKTWFQLVQTEEEMEKRKGGFCFVAELL